MVTVCAVWRMVQHLQTYRTQHVLHDVGLSLTHLITQSLLSWMESMRPVCHYSSKMKKPFFSYVRGRWIISENYYTWQHNLKITIPVEFFLKRINEETEFFVLYVEFLSIHKAQYCMVPHTQSLLKVVWNAFYLLLWNFLSVMFSLHTVEIRTCMLEALEFKYNLHLNTQ